MIAYVWYQAVPCTAITNVEYLQPRLLTLHEYAIHNLVPKASSRTNTCVYVCVCSYLRLRNPMIQCNYSQSIKLGNPALHASQTGRRAAASGAVQRWLPVNSTPPTPSPSPRKGWQERLRIKLEGFASKL